MASETSGEETKVIYHIDEEETPYLIKLNVPLEKVTLGDFKTALNKPSFKYFVKSKDDDFGFVKEEITADEAILPCFKGKVVIWLVTAESDAATDDEHRSHHNGSTRDRTSADSRPSSFHAAFKSSLTNGFNPKMHEKNEHEETESDRIAPLRNFKSFNKTGRHFGGIGRLIGSSTYDTTSMMSSDIDSTSFFDSEDESRLSTATGTTVSSIYGRLRNKRRKKLYQLSRASSFSSITDSTMSLNIVSVTLSMDTVSFLGISIVGQSNRSIGAGGGGDGGIYVGSIMKGGAVALDGRIEPGDMLLEVNGISFEDMSNDEAVRTLREQVQKPGPITLVVAKCWDTYNKSGNAIGPGPSDSVSQMGGCDSTVCGGMESIIGYNSASNFFNVPKQEPVRPIDPRAWVLHTNAILGAENMNHDCNSSTHSAAKLETMPMGASAAMLMAQAGNRYSNGTRPVVANSIISSHAESAPAPIEQLSIHVDAGIIMQAMSHPESGLDVRDRLWLKITIPRAFIGSDLVDWLYRQVDGFADRKAAKKFASCLLKFGYIRHAVNKTKFSEQCYYVFGDWSSTHLSQSNLEEVDSVSVMRHQHAIPVTSTGGFVTSTPSGGQQQSGGAWMMLSGQGGPGSALSSGQYSSVKTPIYPSQTGSTNGLLQESMPMLLGQNNPAAMEKHSTRSSGATSSSSSSSVTQQHQNGQAQQFIHIQRSSSSTSGSDAAPVLQQQRIPSALAGTSIDAEVARMNLAGAALKAPPQPPPRVVVPGAGGYANF
ncbi:Segment polarity protein dishevelled DVL-2 [Cichlidogyrus casuarinus]|uniref:Segment polarity protein dishevelled DVL-2 n=1 Tax=Cichlidogyrus casuarinus TaxID=1844966 RepID=A0ABD2QAV2_9PLAT